VARDVLLGVLALADDGRGEDRVGRRDGGREDEGREELEARDDGIHEGASDHPAHEHAARRGPSVSWARSAGRPEGEGERDAHGPEQHG